MSNGLMVTSIPIFFHFKFSAYLKLNSSSFSQNHLPVILFHNLQTRNLRTTFYFSLLIVRKYSSFLQRYSWICHYPGLGSDCLMSRLLGQPFLQLLPPTPIHLPPIHLPHYKLTFPLPCFPLVIILLKNLWQQFNIPLNKAQTFKVS